MYSFTSTVRYSECDQNSRLTIPAAINYLQDCSMFHCEHIGHGLTYAREHEIAWFAIAWQIQIVRLPHFCDAIRMSTWCNEMRSTLARRSYTIEDGEGDLLVKAEALCALVDTHTGRAIRIPQDESIFLSDEPSLDLPTTQRKVRLAGAGEQVLELEVTERLIDSNGHVNNVQYIAIAEDVVRAREESFEVGRILVQYKVSAHLGDTIVAMLHQEDDGYGIDLTDSDGKSFAVVKLLRH